MTDWRYVFADFGVRSYQVKITFGTGFTARISNRQLIIPRRLSIPFKKRSPENGWFCFFGYIFDTIPNLGHTMRRFGIFTRYTEKYWHTFGNVTAFKSRQR